MSSARLVRKRVPFAGLLAIVAALILILVVIPTVLRDPIPERDLALTDMSILIMRAQSALDAGLSVDRIESLPLRVPADADRLIDPWGSPYSYHAVMNPDGCATISVRSFGPDRASLTDDDITQTETVCPTEK